MIKTYRKKPVTIEAIQFDGSHDSARKIESWAGKAAIDYTDHALFIRTLEGKMHVSVNDYVIRGIQGEFYPCKPDIFVDSYEEVAGV